MFLSFDMFEVQSTPHLIGIYLALTTLSKEQE